MSAGQLDAPPVVTALPEAASSGDVLADLLGKHLPDLPAGGQYLLSDVSWEAYERLLTSRDTHRRGAKVVFNAGELELMTVSNPHERWKSMLGRLLETLCFALRIPLAGSGNVSLRRPDLAGGFEPDICYYIRPAAAQQAVRPIDLMTDPPPDLAIEIELGRSLVDRLELCHGLGIPEIWLFNGQALGFWGMTAAGYDPMAESRAFPGLTVGAVQTFLLRTGTVDDTTLCWEFFDWVRANMTLPTS